jgi:hypothetical protein
VNLHHDKYALVKQIETSTHPLPEYMFHKYLVNRVFPDRGSRQQTRPDVRNFDKENK